AAADHGRDLLALQLGDDAGRLVGQRVEVELVGDTVLVGMAGGLGHLLPGVDALLVPGILGGDDGGGAGLALQVAGGVAGGAAGQALVDVVAHALLYERAVVRGAPGVGPAGGHPLGRHVGSAEAHDPPA